MQGVPPPHEAENGIRGEKAMRTERRIKRVLNGLPRNLRPRCPVCASTLVFNGGRWVCRSCSYRSGELGGKAEVKKSYTKSDMAKRGGGDSGISINPYPREIFCLRPAPKTQCHLAKVERYGEARNRTPSRKTAASGDDGTAGRRQRFLLPRRA